MMCSELPSNISAMGIDIFIYGYGYTGQAMKNWILLSKVYTIKDVYIHEDMFVKKRAYFNYQN